MFPQVATIRCTPKEIKATETYHFDMDFTHSEGFKTKECTGKIQINVPYDGNNHVSYDAIKELKEQVNYRRLFPDDRALIGYLHFQNHANTDIDENYELSIDSDILPIDIALKQAPLKNIKELTNDKYVQELSVEYSPQPPPNSPLTVRCIVTDEEFSYNEKPLEHKMPKFKKDLLFSFHFIFSSSLAKEALPEEKKPFIKKFSLNWPKIPSAKEIKTSTSNIKDSQKPVSYDSESKQVVYEGIDLSFNQSRKNYVSEKLVLKIPEPGELYTDEHLHGEIELEFPKLLSNLSLNYFKADGEISKFEIDYSSKIKVSFKLDIYEKFQEKIHIPSQLIQFPHVILDNMRIADIKSILRDKRFDFDEDRDVEIENHPDNPKLINSARIRGIRQEGTGPFYITVQLIGRDSKTEREKAIPGDEKFKTEFETGGLVCEIQGELVKDTQTVVNVLNEIHQLMKERFRHVNVLD